jgi:predicted ATPase/DNA-binding CsgD family transcriptional regulator
MWRLLETSGVRLLTLTGPGGVGKTSLAMRLAVEFEAAHGSRALFISLGAVSDARLVVSTISEALDLRPEGAVPLLERLAIVLRRAPLLLVLDNLEQVIDCASDVAWLLGHCPDLTVLATSRVPLRIVGEQEYPVPPLELPEPEGASPEAMMTSAAVVLFTQRAQAVRPDFRVTADNAGTIAAICRRLDGLPLAIELAAARSRLLSPRALLARLGQRLSLLTNGPRDAPARLQTMRDAIAWSDSLLAPPLQALFWQLAVFVGGWTLEAAEGVIDPALQADLEGGVLGGLAALIEHSLIEQVEQPDGEPRFRMLETIREYALEQLDASAMAYDTHLRHATWFRDLATENGFSAFGPNEFRSFLSMQPEIANCRAALEWALIQPGMGLGAEIAGGLTSYWLIEGNWREGLDYLERARSLVALLDGISYPLVLVQFALLLGYSRTDVPGAIAMCDEAIVRLETEEHASFRVRGLLVRPEDILVRTLMVRAQDLILSGDNAGAAADLRRVSEEEWGLRNGSLVAVTRMFLGHLALVDGDAAAAEELFLDALAIQRHVGNHNGAGWPLERLARLARERGEHVEAAALFLESLEARWAHGNRPGSLVCLRGLADVALDTQRHAVAARLLAATEALGEAIGSFITGLALERFRQRIATAQAALDPETFAVAWADGRALTANAIIALARAFTHDLAESPDPCVAKETERGANLSPREIDVLRLVAAGCSTAEIAEQLFVSPRTVTTHLTSIYNKLGFNTRAAAARFAVEHGLV